MKQIVFEIIFCALTCAAMPAAAQNTTSAASSKTAAPVIHIEDVDRFYRVYDAAGGHPTADQLQRDYIDPGSDGLHEFAKLRNISGATIAKTMTEHPEIYSDAKRCMAVLPGVRQRLQVALEELRRLYPDARLLPVTIAVGRGRPVATGGPGHEVHIGLEALCATNWLNPNVEDRFVHVIAHEYAHVQQSPVLAKDEHPTVLELSVIEGAGEFTAELISGDVAYSQFKASTEAQVKEIETTFVSDEDQTDLSKWFNNSTREKAGDFGYLVGYRIVKSYYQHAGDKTRAFREILEMTDPKAFLVKSGWYPGIHLQ
jgi:hypothetical protein